MSVRIAHISDLHFGMKGQPPVWGSLRRLLTAKQTPGQPDLRPDLLLITGDIVDSPNEDWFIDAKSEISVIAQSGIKCFVCPGNHDRHEQGNTLEGLPEPVQKPAGLLRKAAGFFAPKEPRKGPSPTATQKVSAHFDKQFAGMYLALLNPQTEMLKGSTSDVEWRVRLIGLDSSVDARYFAQGHISPEMLDELRGACAFKGRDEDAPDLVIAMIHHHLLPITANEGSLQRIGSVLSGTTVLNNAGSVLETLAEGQVNLVLHGHEHASHLARYSSFLGRRGEVIVVGAGSATGAKTGEGCDTSRARFNLLELDDERNVTLREVRYEAGQWRVMQAEYQLLSARDIRRARYFRRRPDAATPESRWERHFEFMSSRDIFIREMCTNWVIENGIWSAFTSNWSGKPWFIGGEIKLASGETLPMKSDQEMALVDSKSRIYCVTETVPTAAAGNQYARSIEHEIMWVTGAVLSQDDLSRCAAATRGPFRDEDKEYIGTTVTRGLESLTMTLELPEGYAPDGMAFEVIAETKYGDHYQLKELQDRLRVTGRRKVNVAITVPYPLLGATYWIVWKPPVVPPVKATLEASRRVLAALSDSVVDALTKALLLVGVPEKHTLGLYVPELHNHRLAFRAIGMRGDRPEPPQRVVPTANENSFCMAHWGLPQIFSAKTPGEPDADEAAGGLLPGEAAILVVPLTLAMTNSGESLGIVRVGLLSQCEVQASPQLLRKVVAAAQSTSGIMLELLRD